MPSRMDRLQLSNEHQWVCLNSLYEWRNLHCEWMGQLLQFCRHTLNKIWFWVIIVRPKPVFFIPGSNKLLHLSLCAWFLWSELWNWCWWVFIQPLQEWRRLHSEPCILGASIHTLSCMANSQRFLLIDLLCLCWTLHVQVQGEVCNNVRCLNS